MALAHQKESQPRYVRMRNTLIALMLVGAVGLTADVMAQSSSSGGSSSGGASSTGGATGTGATTGTGTSGMGVDSRDNSQVIPPSRLLRKPGENTTETTGQRPGVDGTPMTGQRPGDPNQPIPQGSGGIGSNSSLPGNRTGRNNVDDAAAECMRLWDAATHMTKPEWSRACRRIQTRFDQLDRDSKSANKGQPDAVR